MFFQWPEYLWLMIVVPLLPAVYLWLLRRRGKVAVRFSSLNLVRAAATGRNWRRHVPPALLLLACATLLLAGARPVAPVPRPWAPSTIILAMDVSLSMRVNDVKPTRMAATLNRAPLVAAIDVFQMQRGTAIGNAIALSVADLFPDHGINLGDMTFSGKPRGRSLDDTARPAPMQITPVAPGSYLSAAIILLTDGRPTTGIDTLEAAKLAADGGGRIHVVGLSGADGGSYAADGMAMYLQLDEPTLREVARMTGGDHHHAGTAEKLRGVYETLGSQMQIVKRETELAPLLALAAALLALAADVLSILWFGRIA